jgi:hypothetical protein
LRVACLSGGSGFLDQRLGRADIYVTG